MRNCEKEEIFISLSMLIADPVIWNKSGILSLSSDVILLFVVYYNFFVILLHMLNFNYHDYGLSRIFMCNIVVHSAVESILAF